MAIPFMVGDSFNGRRIVGTSSRPDRGGKRRRRPARSARHDSARNAR
jgi:hypothetical protein